MKHTSRACVVLEEGGMGWQRLLPFCSSNVFEALSSCAVFWMEHALVVADYLEIHQPISNLLSFCRYFFPLWFCFYVIV